MSPRSQIARATAVVTTLAAAAAIRSQPAAPRAPAPLVTIVVNGTTPVAHVVSAAYLGVNIDTASLYHDVDLTNTKLAALVRQLGPTALRIGGTAADAAFYVPDATSAQDGPARIVISDATWANVLAFGIAAGVTELLWDLNALAWRDNATHAWDPAPNATALLARTAAAARAPPMSWSVGNEPNLDGKAAVGPGTLAADAGTLAAALAAAGLPVRVYGPSYAEFPSAPIESYFKATKGKGVLTGFTAHTYPYKHECSAAQFLKRGPVDTMARELAGVYRQKLKYADEGLLLVLEETAGMYGGGCRNMTDRFISGFAWIHMLGVIGESGWDRVHRQDVVGWSSINGSSNYQLAGPPGWSNGSDALTPHPDYFTSVLWKQNMGSVALSTTAAGDAPVVGNVSAHVWCTAAAAAAGAGAVTLAFANPTASAVAFAIGGVPGAPRVEFVLTASSLTADVVLLNGTPLAVDAGGELPASPLPGVAVPAGAPDFVAPPLSYGYVTYTAAAVPACAG